MCVIDVIGYVATILMIISPVPQLWETYRTKSIEGLSISMLLTLLSGCILMAIYISFTSQSVPLLLNYGVSTIILTLNVYLYYKYK